MRVALVHDYLKEFGGAERVLMALHEIWPKAPIYTTVYLPSFLGPHKEKLTGCNVKPSLLRHVPFKAKLLSLFRFVGPLVFKTMDLSEYDVVVVSAAGTYTSPNLIKTKPGTIHICYCHTPPRYLYGYPTAAPWDKVWWRKILKFFGQVPMHFLRMIDFQAAQRVDYFIANSKNTAARIEKFYRREAAVIYPPVELPGVSMKRHPKGVGMNEGYFLAGGRLARAKRIDLAVEACARLGLPLKVFGRMFAGYGEELKKISNFQFSPENKLCLFPISKIEFLGEVSDEEKSRLMANCKAFIFPAEEEDFGITPVEAMAYGKPVIALRQGGVMESVVDPSTSPSATSSGPSGSGQGATGVFFDEPTVESLIRAIKKFRNLEIKKEDCVRQARKFSKERFKKEMKEFVEEKVADGC